jgi:hypothetical protein
MKPARRQGEHHDGQEHAHEDFNDAEHGWGGTFSFRSDYNTGGSGSHKAKGDEKNIARKRAKTRENI